MRYKMIALDLDGTLLDDEKKISQANRRWIQEAVQAGIKICFATGRGWHTVKDYLEELQIDPPLVLANGAEVWAEPGRLLERHPLSREVVQALHQLAVEHDAWYWGYSVEGLFTKRTWQDHMFDYQWLKIGIRHDSLERIAQLREIVRSWQAVEVTHAAPVNMEVTCRGITKAYGLARLCAYFGFELSEVMALGDSHNDLLMLQSVGLGVAMGNAEDALKRAADEALTATNNENGVALAIARYAFQAETEIG